MEIFPEKVELHWEIIFGSRLTWHTYLHIKIENPSRRAWKSKRNSRTWLQSFHPKNHHNHHRHPICPLFSSTIIAFSTITAATWISSCTVEVLREISIFSRKCCVLLDKMQLHHKHVKSSPVLEKTLSIQRLFQCTLFSKRIFPTSLFVHMVAFWLLCLFWFSLEVFSSYIFRLYQWMVVVAPF